jgi:geranylgeranylglycerol-phosphate geranylgeranyltransferase
MLLSISGGFIINPSIAVLIGSSKLITAATITQLIMWNSMIINDLFDMNIDKINSPNRPLITGEISKREAIISSSVLLGLSEFLNLRYLPISLHWVTHIANIIIIIYTPILKKIPFIKNISCAVLVSFANIFSGLTVSDNLYLIDNEKLTILSISTLFIFLVKK